MKKFTYIDHKANHTEIFSIVTDCILKADEALNSLLGIKVETWAYSHIGCRIE